MLKQMKQKTVKVEGLLPQWFIKEDDFIDIIKKQLDDFNMIRNPHNLSGNYLNEEDAKRILYNMHKSICEIT